MRKSFSLLMLMMVLIVAGCSSAPQDAPCVEGVALESMTTEVGVEYVRTPDACFEALPDWPYEPQYVEIDGLRQAYVDVGPADAQETILLLHGQPSWSYLYRKMIPVLEGAGHRVIAMDHLGMGRSDKPIDPNYYTYLGHIERLEAFIQELELENITLFAQDWGSLIGLYVVGTNPDWFDRVVIGNGFLPTFQEGTVPYELPDNPKLTRRLFHKAITSIPEQQPAFYDDEGNLLEEREDHFSVWIDYARNDERFQASQILEAMTYYDLSEEELAAYNAPFPSRTFMGGPRAFPGLVNQLPGVTEAGWEGLGRFEKPVLTIWAGNDPGNLGQPEVQQALIDHIPGSEGWGHVRLPEASHFLQDDQGEEIARRINAFIEQQTGQTEGLTTSNSGAWYDSLVSSEHSDSERTHRFAEAEFLGSEFGENEVVQEKFKGSFPTSYNIVTRGEHEWFVYGGGYGDYPRATGAFIARLDADTLNEVWRTELINTDETGDWNYPGVVGLHENGDLYVVYGYHIARLDPDTGAVIQEQELPSPAAPRDTSYNGFNVLPDGTIVAKAVYREAGCEEQGFGAFLRCDDPENVPASIMVAIDPDTLSIIDEIDMPEVTGGRVTTTRFDGADYIYMTGADNAFRYTFDGSAFELDEEWGFVPYREKGQSLASAIAVMNDWVVMQTNAVPSRKPLSVIAISQADSGQIHRIEPFSNRLTIVSFIPAMLTVDPENSRIYAHDTFAGRIAGLDFDPDTGMSVAWTVEQTTLHFTTLVGPAHSRVLIGTDKPDVNFFTIFNLGALADMKEQVVWRDADTGRDLARSELLPAMTSGVLVTPGYNGVVYYLSLDGEIFELLAYYLRGDDYDQAKNP
jgi:haloalkane dehalogenase